MQEQKIAIGIKGEEKPTWFFFDHSFKTAHEHAQEFLRRNKEKREYTVFQRNYSSFGPTWKTIH